MTHTKFTPGPWQASGLGRYIFGPRHTTIARLAKNNDADRQVADARLIAAAPDLVDALQWALDQIDDDLDPYHQQTLAHARAVLAAALGN